MSRLPTVLIAYLLHFLLSTLPPIPATWEMLPLAMSECLQSAFESCLLKFLATQTEMLTTGYKYPKVIVC